jgi:malate/lactate dehydrogenase
VSELITDVEWIRETLIKQVLGRGAEIIGVKKFSSVPSAASAACDQVHDWIMGTRPGEYVSMGVSSDGN